MSDNIKIGDVGEKLGEEYLIKKGYNILQTNFKCKAGEIDIIALDNEFLVFIEVKTRRNNNYGFPFEAVNRSKQMKIKLVANYYLNIKKHLNKKCRFDVLSIQIKDWPRNSDYYIDHIKEAF